VKVQAALSQQHSAAEISAVPGIQSIQIQHLSHRQLLSCCHAAAACCPDSTRELGLSKSLAIWFVGPHWLVLSLDGQTGFHNSSIGFGSSQLVTSERGACGGPLALSSFEPCATYCMSHDSISHWPVLNTMSSSLDNVPCQFPPFPHPLTVKVTTYFTSLPPCGTCSITPVTSLSQFST
jgi:hypothetical protein